jgi:hypothetical protein
LKKSKVVVFSPANPKITQQNPASCTCKAGDVISKNFSVRGIFKPQQRSETNPIMVQFKLSKLAEIGAIFNGANHVGALSKSHGFRVKNRHVVQQVYRSLYTERQR